MKPRMARRICIRKINRRLEMAFTLLVLFGYAAKCGAVDFSDARKYPVGSNPSGAVVADFDGDGRLDLAVANTGSKNVSILLGNGDGTFQSAMNFDAGNSPLQIATGDFDGDGKLDLAVFQPANQDNVVTGSIGVLLGNGDGSFQSPKTMTLTESASAMAIADFNGDSKSDLAVSNIGSSDVDPNVSVFLGKGDGTFHPAKTLSVPSGNGTLGVADFNGDAKSDLAVGGVGGIQIFIGNGDGTFRQGSTATVADGFNVSSIQVADIARDGKLELLVETSASFHSPDPEGLSSSTTRISVFHGNGNGTFQAEQIVITATVTKLNVFAPSSGSSISQMFLGDFNGDGKLDLAFRGTSFLAFKSFSTLAMALGKVDGSFSSALFFLSDTGPVLVAKDLNADKLSDFVVHLGASNEVTMLLNTSPTSGADIGVIHSGGSPDPVGIGDHLAYSAEVFNNGPQDVTGVTFTDTLPSATTFLSATVSQGSCIQSHRIVTCNIGSLLSASDAQVFIEVIPTTAGVITNSMNVSAKESDPALENNSVVGDTTVVSVFTLTTAKTGNGVGVITQAFPELGSIDCGNSCSARFLGGTNVSLRAKPSGTSVFAGWSGACTGPDPDVCNVIMNSNESVTATFNPGPDFSLSAGVPNLSLKRGGQASEVLTLAAQGNFSGTIVLACSLSGPSPIPSCSVSPNSVTPGNSATLTVNAAAMATASSSQSSQRIGSLYSLLVPVGILGCVLMSSFDRRRWRFWAVCLLLTLAIFPAACGGGAGDPPASAVNYTLKVTATSGPIQHSTQVIVTVN